MHDGFLLLYAQTFPCDIVLDFLLHNWPVEPLFRKVEYYFGTNVSHVIMEMFKGYRSVLYRKDEL